MISKDLSLWNQQGSQVLRGQIQVLPIDNTFLFVAPIYIQAKQARMPQLERVVLAAGNQLVYADTYQEGLKQLAVLRGVFPAPVTSRGIDISWIQLRRAASDGRSQYGWPHPIHSRPS